MLRLVQHSRAEPRLMDPDGMLHLVSEDRMYADIRSLVGQLAHFQ